jgi:HSP20 family molecular chaperone IbpA
VDFDVRDYRPEELSIKTEGDVLIVLAKHETKAEGGGTFVSKQFEQRFTLPSGVAPESITSSLAKDGTLTVSAPRERQRTAATELFKRVSSPTNNVYTHSAADQEEGLPHPRVKYDEDKFQISLDCQNYKPEELDVKVEGSSIIIQAKQEQKEAGGTRTRVFEQKFTLPSGVKAEKVSSYFGKDGVLTITAPRANAITPYSAIEQRMDRVLSPSNWEDNFQTPSRPLIGLGSSREHYHPKHSSIFDRDPAFFAGSEGGGGGISKVQYDDDNYKILVNVQDFKPEELMIKTVGNTVHFEAKHEEKTSDGHAFTSRNISQSFTLPRGVDPETVSSALSKDGVLTISAPLPVAALKLQGNERLVPIKHR